MTDISYLLSCKMLFLLPLLVIRRRYLLFSEKSGSFLAVTAGHINKYLRNNQLKIAFLAAAADKLRTDISSFLE